MENIKGEIPKWFNCVKCHKVFRAYGKKCSSCINCNESPRFTYYANVQVKCPYKDCGHEQTLRCSNLLQMWFCAVCKRHNEVIHTLR